MNRTGVLRQDRTDAIPRAKWDHALPFTMLPFGSLSYHGATAELRDIPLGTHLHGQFYFDEKAGKDGKGAFTKVLRLEDDFSFSARQKRLWRIEAFDLENGKLTAIGAGPEEHAADAKPAIFEVNAATRVWKGRAIGTLNDLAAGQAVLLDLTICTLAGPGRCTDIWLDAESREVATAQQLEVHRQFQREHGLAGWVDEVDNQTNIMTVTLFAGFDPSLAEDYPLGSIVAAAVAEETLRTYEQIGDVMKGPILDLKRVPAAPGSSGLRLTFKPGTLLEGYRPRRILRLFSGKWRMQNVPREERLLVF